MRVKMFFWVVSHEIKTLGPDIAAGGKYIEYTGMLVENFLLRDVEACLPF